MTPADGPESITSILIQDRLEQSSEGGSHRELCIST